MSATDGQMTSKHGVVEISPDNAGPWTDISSAVSGVSQSGGDHKTGEQNVLGSPTPVTGIGAKNAVTLTITTVYTEDSAEAFALLQGYFEDQTTMWIRVTPDGNVANYRFKGSGKVSACPMPSIDAGAGDILVADVTWFGNEMEWQGSST